MTGPNLYVYKCKQSRSYLNHLVFSKCAFRWFILYNYISMHCAKRLVSNDAYILVTENVHIHNREYQFSLQSVFFWEFPRHLKFKSRRFGTQCRFHRPGRSGSPRTMEPTSVPKHRLLNFRRWGNSQKNTDCILNTAKVLKPQQFSLITIHFIKPFSSKPSQ